MVYHCVTHSTAIQGQGLGCISSSKQRKTSDSQMLLPLLPFTSSLTILVVLFLASSGIFSFSVHVQLCFRKMNDEYLLIPTSNNLSSTTSHKLCRLFQVNSAHLACTVHLPLFLLFCSPGSLALSCLLSSRVCVKQPHTSVCVCVCMLVAGQLVSWLWLRGRALL